MDRAILPEAPSLSQRAQGNKRLIVISLVVAPWCNPLTLQTEQSGGVGSNSGRAPPLERHDKESRTRLGLLYFCDPSTWR